jgi:hypothetical protein
LFVCVACFLLKVKDRFEDLRNVFILFWFFIYWK